MKSITETKAGKSLTVHVIYKGDKYIGKVLAHYSDSGACTVEAYDGNKLIHQRKACGFGYDKFTSALSGAIIEGHKITNHCEVRLPLPEAGYFPEGFQAPPGYHLSNREERGWKSCYKISGLDYLKNFGYTVIHVL